MDWHPPIAGGWSEEVSTNLDCLTLEGTRSKRFLQFYGPGGREECEEVLGVEKYWVRVGKKIVKVSSIQTSEQRLQGRNATTYMSTAGRGPWVFDCKPLWDYNTQAVQESGVQEAAFSLKVCQVKPLELPVVRPEEAHTGFHPATKLLQLYLAAREAGKLRVFLFSQ